MRGSAPARRASCVGPPRTHTAAGGVLFHESQDGQVSAYAAAGILARDGTFVVALDAKTGNPRWINSTCGQRGVSVQGGMTIAGSKLRLCGGLQVSPAGFDLATGAFEPLAGQYDSRERPQGAALTKGAEIGTFRERHVIYGGRPLFSERTNAVYRGRFNCLSLTEDGTKKAIELGLTNLSTIPPAWDADMFVMPAAPGLRSPSKLVCWDSAKLTALLDSRSNPTDELQAKENRLAELSRSIQVTKELTDGEIVRWSIPCDANALVLAGDAVVVTCAMTPKGTTQSQWRLRALSKANGKTIWEHKLDFPPALNGLCLDRNGNIIVAMNNGRVCAFGER